MGTLILSVERISMELIYLTHARYRLVYIYQKSPFLSKHGNIRTIFEYKPDQVMYVYIYKYIYIYLLPNGRKEREVLVVGSIPVTILPSCQYMKILHYNCTYMNIVG